MVLSRNEVLSRNPVTKYIRKGERTTPQPVVQSQLLTFHYEFSNPPSTFPDPSVHFLLLHDMTWTSIYAAHA